MTRSSEEAAVLAFLHERLTREVDKVKQTRDRPTPDLKKSLRASVRQETKAVRAT